MARLDLTILRGSTFSYVLRWGSSPIVYKPIAAVVSLAPLRLTVTGHGLVNGWYVAISDVLGMTEANAKGTPPRRSEYQKVTVIDVNTIEFNGLNATSYTPYISGGNIQYKTPVNLAGYTGALDFRSAPDLTLPVLFTMTSANSRIVLDNTLKTITLTILAADSVPLALSSATYDLELTSSAGVKTKLVSGYGTTVDESTA